MKNSFIVMNVLLWGLSGQAGAGQDWLIAGELERIAQGQPFRVNVVRPAGAEWPGHLMLTLISAQGNRSQLNLIPEAPGENSGIRQVYVGHPGSALDGMIRAELADFPSNRIILLAEADDGDRSVGASVDQEIGETAQAPATSQSELAAKDTLPALSVNEPMYFLYGEAGRARFQLSFKYRLFSPHGPIVEWLPVLGGMYFGYTQNSFWDLGGASKPFYDTSYRPSLFWEGGGNGGLWPSLWRGGYEHQSNGRDEEASRSIDTLFFQPVWERMVMGNQTFTFAPKFYAYLDKSENDGIQKYRGFADWVMKLGKEDGWMLRAQYRQGTSDYASIQMDASYPLSTEIFSNIGSFFHIQYFSGYGESLLDYNRRSSDQLRIGISIVR